MPFSRQPHLNINNAVGELNTNFVNINKISHAFYEKCNNFMIMPFRNAIKQLELANFCGINVSNATAWTEASCCMCAKVLIFFLTSFTFSICYR